MLGEIGQLGCLANISRFLANLLILGTRSPQHVLLRAGRLAGQGTIARPGCSRSRLCINWLKPRLLPENQAARLATSVCLPIASKIQMNSVRQSSTPSAGDSVTGLVRAFVNLEPLTAILKHLRHKGQPLQPTILVQ